MSEESAPKKPARSTKPKGPAKQKEPDAKETPAPAAPLHEEKPTTPPAEKPEPGPKTTPAVASKPAPKPARKPAKSEPKLAEKDAPVRPRPAAETYPSATVVDASGLVLGRAASLIAKRLLLGETVVVLNAEKSVVTGNRPMVVSEYTAARAQGSVRSGPHFPRYPDRIFRRTVRGMLPHLKSRGKVAYDRLHVFIGVPPEFTGRSSQSLEEARARPALRPPTSLAEITRLLGARL